MDFDDTGIVSEVIIDDIGLFVLEFLPKKRLTYNEMLYNKKFVARKIIEQLNKIYLQVEADLEKGDE